MCAAPQSDSAVCQHGIHWLAGGRGRTSQLPLEGHRSSQRSLELSLADSADSLSARAEVPHPRKAHTIVRPELAAGPLPPLVERSSLVRSTYDLMGCVIFDSCRPSVGLSELHSICARPLEIVLRAFLLLLSELFSFVLLRLKGRS